MEEENIYEETVQTPLWRTVGVYFVDAILLPLAAMFIVYAIWLALGLPDFTYLWLILFVMFSVLISTVVKNKWGTTPGRKLFNCNPSQEQTKKVSTTLLWIVVLFWLATKFFLPSKSVTANNIENDYYQVDVPKEWRAEHLNDKEPLFHCLAVGKTQNDCALFFTVNYNTIGIPLENMVNMTLGGMNRANMPDITVENTIFNGLPATKIKGTLQGNKIDIIAFYGPSGVFSYVMSQNLTDQEFDNVIDGTKLKDTKPSFADFDLVWSNFMGNTDEWNIYQPIDQGMTLEGWTYNRKGNSLTLRLLFEASSEDIKSYFSNPDNEQAFFNNIKENQIMIPIANNYGKKVIVDLKDMSGNVAYTIN